MKTSYSKKCLNRKKMQIILNFANANLKVKGCLISKGFRGMHVEHSYTARYWSKSLGTSSMQNATCDSESKDVAS